MKDKRPDPDELLRRFKSEEKTRKRGRLKIFFGAYPGVGKTHAMLEAARVKKNQGVDVVVGYLETHTSKEIGALLEGLEVIPLEKARQKSAGSKEFNLDGALQRRPALILIDQLAHTNSEGRRHMKRWQDVEELLESGIDVYSTLNVQHLESLHDIVVRLADVMMWETLPDSVL